MENIFTEVPIALHVIAVPSDHLDFKTAITI